MCPPVSTVMGKELMAPASLAFSPPFYVPVAAEGEVSPWVELLRDSIVEWGFAHLEVGPLPDGVPQYPSLRRKGNSATVAFRLPAAVIRRRLQQLEADMSVNNKFTKGEN